MSESKPKILICQKLPPDVEARLDQLFDCTFNEEDKRYNLSGVLGLAQGKDALVCAPGDAITGELIEQLPDSVKIIATFSVGFEHVDVKAARARGILVTNTPGVLTDATADIALLCILGAARRAAEGMEMIRTDTWDGWRPTQLMGTHLSGLRLGILGMGRIGQATAQRARAFGMKIHYHNRRKLPTSQELGAVFHEHPDDLLKVSDVLSLHCPLTPETRKFVNAERINLLPDGAIVVNTARGGVVDDVALIEAMRSGKLASIGLDVFEGEPAIHPDYRTLPNAFLLPHLGSGTVHTRNAMGACVIENLIAWSQGKEPPNRVA